MSDKSHECLKSGCYFCYEMKRIVSPVKHYTCPIIGRKNYTRTPFTQKELNIIMRNYRGEIMELLPLIPDRTINSITWKVWQMKKKNLL